MNHSIKRLFPKRSNDKYIFPNNVTKFYHNFRREASPRFLDLLLLHTRVSFSKERCKEQQSRATIILLPVNRGQRSKIQIARIPRVLGSKEQGNVRFSIPFRVINRTRGSAAYRGSLFLVRKEIGSFELSNYLIALVNAVFPCHDRFIGGVERIIRNLHTAFLPSSPIWNHVEKQVSRGWSRKRTLIKIEIAKGFFAILPSKVIKVIN